METVPLLYTVSEDGSILVPVSMSVYSIEPILKAMHAFSGRCHTQIGSPTDGVVRCWLRGRNGPIDPQSLANEFLNELLDQALRARLAEQTEPIRRLIIAQAFSRTDLIGDQSANPPQESTG